MADPTNRTVSKSNLKLKVNLKELLGTELPNDPQLREQIGQAIIEKIIKRTESGVDVKGKPFAKYSPNYIKSAPFKAFDKSKGEVNLELSGDMLGLMDIVGESRNSVTIGWGDEDQIPKAFNHITGDTVKKRDFFGLTKEDLDSLKSEFLPKVKDAQSSDDSGDNG